MFSLIKSDSHPKWDIDQPYKGEYDEGGDEVVGLVVDQVVDHPVRPPASVVGVGHLKPVTIFVKDFDQMGVVVGNNQCQKVSHPPTTWNGMTFSQLDDSPVLANILQ